MQVAAVLTRATPAQVAGALVYGYGKVTGTAPPTRTSWLLPLAQSALETDHWRACWNHNLGNYTTTAGVPGYPDATD